MPVTPEILKLINILPEPTYIENCIVHWYEKGTNGEEINVLDLVVDFFHWMSVPQGYDEQTGKKKPSVQKYYCIIPAFKIYYQAIMFMLTYIYECKFNSVRLAFLHWGIQIYKNVEPKKIVNFPYPILKWMMELKEEEVMGHTIEYYIEELAKKLVENLPSSNITEEDREKLLQEVIARCQKDIEQLSQSESDQLKTCSLPDSSDSS